VSKLIAICVYLTGIGCITVAGVFLGLPAISIALLYIIWAVCIGLIFSLEG
jgi:hypothetical protein